ncbi:hypothetical protein ACFFRR_006732 [Megaselia abdita]
MCSKAVFVLCIVYFLGSAAAVEKCWFNNCQNSTICTPEPVVCTQDTVKSSIAYLNSKFNYSISTQNLSNEYDCFYYTSYHYEFFIDAPTITTYTDYKSCLSKNIDLCHIRKRTKRDTELGDSGVEFCEQCKTDMCNSSGSIVGSWKIVSAIVSFLLFSGVSFKN